MGESKMQRRTTQTTTTRTRTTNTKIPMSSTLFVSHTGASQTSKFRWHECWNPKRFRRSLSASSGTRFPTHVTHASSQLVNPRTTDSQIDSQRDTQTHTDLLLEKGVGDRRHELRRKDGGVAAVRCRLPCDCQLRELAPCRDNIKEVSRICVLYLRRQGKIERKTSNNLLYLV